MRDYFLSIADYLDSLLRGNEAYTCAFAGEVSDFVRFNRARVRQAGHVAQRTLMLDLIEGRRHASAEVTLSGNSAPDRSRLAATVDKLRGIRTQLPEDPYLCYATEVKSSDRSHPNQLPDSAAMVEETLTAAAGRDLVGIHASGAIHDGFANSLGQRNWFTRHSFNLDWSLYLHTDKAVKARYAGLVWEREQLQARMSAAVEQLEVLARPVRTLGPGRYRVYLPAVALEEIIGLLGWGGFSMRAHRTGTSPLGRMVEGGASLSSAVTLSENTAAGVAPDFQAAGFVRPDRVILIEDGCYRDCLVSPRSAAEYNVAGNGAGDHEAPLSMDMAPGDLPEDEVLRALDTGICVGNLWYLNYSDRNAGRLTGMTRFATFWVENGRIQAPVKPMRFDETVYHLLGKGLMGLTVEREMLLDPGSYGARSNCSARLPGALVDGVSFTL